MRGKAFGDKSSDRVPWLNSIDRPKLDLACRTMALANSDLAY